MKHYTAVNSNYSTPYKFTGKELDKETGLYYFGARYYDARVSRWISADPALQEGKYFPKPNDYDTEHDFYWYILNDASGKLPGMGGVYNAINLDVYHYAGQNPVKLVDPDGNELTRARLLLLFKDNNSNTIKTVNNKNNIINTRILQNDNRLIPGGRSACRYRALQSIAESYAGKNLTVEQINEATKELINTGSIETNYYVNDPVAVISDALKRLGVNVDKLLIQVKGNVGNDIPKDTIATLRGVPNMDQLRSGQDNAIGHWQHGDKTGEFIWDPWNGTTSGADRPVNRIDAVIIKRKEE